jgi:hypothetical protein
MQQEKLLQSYSSSDFWKNLGLVGAGVLIVGGGITFLIIHK